MENKEPEPEPEPDAREEWSVKCPSGYKVLLIIYFLLTFSGNVAYTLSILSNYFFLDSLAGLYSLA